MVEHPGHFEKNFAMFTIDLEELELLLDEVVTVVESPDFLSGSDAPVFQEFPFGDFNSFWCVSSIQDFLYSLDRDITEWPSTPGAGIPQDKYPEHYQDFFEELAEEEYESPYFTLTEGVLTDLRENFLLVDRFSISEVSAAIEKRKRKIESFLKDSEAVTRLAQQIHIVDQSGKDGSEFRELIQKDMILHLETVMQCRALTLDRRYLVTELLLQSYQHGLFPIGWNWGCDTLFCLRPE